MSSAAAFKTTPKGNRLTVAANTAARIVFSTGINKLHVSAAVDCVVAVMPSNSASPVIAALPSAGASPLSTGFIDGEPRYLTGGGVPVPFESNESYTIWHIMCDTSTTLLVAGGLALRDAFFQAT